MRAAVVPLPRGGVDQPVVRAEVDDPDVEGASCGRERAGRAVRQGEEDQFGAAEDLGVGRLEDDVRPG